ncbi:hypothetical protein D9757_008758 [Collybiopsis confluens]|uniref:Peptidase A1 domain-containing protein n=1 Tax=Collybiopsis confluens TaxID=2823264 RepID=A0A8H5H536_9AGAR|nr:hypothetical protein D9757_008758 [Collybiopsis confluens]
MFSSTSLLTVVTLVLGFASGTVIVVDRSPILSLPLKRINNFTSGHDILAHDLARINKFDNRAKAHGSDKPAKRQAEPVINEVVSYIASVGVGANDKQSTDTGELVEVSYGSGDFVGLEFIDRVTLTPSLVIQQQSIGIAIESDGFEGVDGILGIGPVALTEGTVDGSVTVPTVTDNLFALGSITENLVSISFEPTTTEEITNGELFFGGTDSSKFTGNITFVPKVGDFWGISQSVSYGGTTIIDNLSGIVDTGTTLLLMTTASFDAYIAATGGVLNENVGLFSITAAQFAALKPLEFNIGGTTFSLTANAQIFPRSLNVDIGGTANDIFLIAGDLGGFPFSQNL